MWPLAGAGKPRVLEGHAQGVNGVAFSPDGAALVTAGYDATLRIWPLRGKPPDVATLPARSTLSPLRPMARSSPAVGDGIVYLLSAPGERKGEIDGRRNADHRACALARREPDCRGRHARLGRHHRAPSRTLVRTLVGPGLPVWSVAFFRTSAPFSPAAPMRDPALGRDHGEPIDDRGRGPPADPLAAFAGDHGAEVFRACVACHTLHADEGRARGRPWPGFSAAGSQRLPGYNFSPR